MKWIEEKHGADTGYRAQGFYVGKTFSGFWRVWMQGPKAWHTIGPAFADLKEAQRYAVAGPR